MKLSGDDENRILTKTQVRSIKRWSELENLSQFIRKCILGIIISSVQPLLLKENACKFGTLWYEGYSGSQ